MEGAYLLATLSAAMFIGSYLAGSIPLAFTLSQVYSLNCKEKLMHTFFSAHLKPWESGQLLKKIMKGQEKLYSEVYVVHPKTLQKRSFFYWSKLHGRSNFSKLILCIRTCSYMHIPVICIEIKAFHRCDDKIGGIFLKFAESYTFIEYIRCRTSCRDRFVCDYTRRCWIAIRCTGRFVFAFFIH